MTFYHEGREVEIPEVKCWYPQTVVYDPIKAGSIDGTDIEPHDNGIIRALNSNYKPSYKAKGNPQHTIFVGKLSLDTTEKDLENEFCRYGKMIALRLVRDIITGLSKRYAFIEYETFEMAMNAYVCCKSLILKNSEVLVDFECGRLLPGWKPRRLGGGFGGEKQSGQLRFGGRTRCFRPPLNLVEFKNKGIHNEKSKKIRKSNKTSQSTKNMHSNFVSTTSASATISLPLTPPSQSAIVLPLTPPSNTNALLPLTPPSQSIIVLPLTPPLNSTVTLPLTPPSHSTTSLPLTPPSNSIPPP